MGYLVEGLELFISKVAYTKYDATGLVRWSNYISVMTLCRVFVSGIAERCLCVCVRACGLRSPTLSLF
jgi:hypothetical protein